MRKIDTNFADVAIILDDNGSYFGVMTQDSIEACNHNIKFAYGRKVLSSLRETKRQIDSMLKARLDFEYPKGFSISIDENDLAVFITQEIGIDSLNAYMESKRIVVAEEINKWRRERSWDTFPVFSDELQKLNFSFDPDKQALHTDGGVNEIRKLEIPTSVDGVRVKVLAPYALSSFRLLEDLYISDSIEEIPEYLCYGFIYMHTVRLSSNIIKIPNDCFGKCKVLKHVTIPEGIIEIGTDAFYMDCSIERLRLPETLKKVGGCAFVGVRKLDYKGLAPGYPWGASSVLAKVNY